MGIKNYLIDGASCSGKTTVCLELQRRGHQGIHGDRELAYWGSLETEAPAAGDDHTCDSWIWKVDKVRALVADQTHPVTFFCGGSRNLDRFIDLFDEVFVLEVDIDTLNRRLSGRPADEWGGSPTEGEASARSYVVQKKYPKNAIIIDATQSLSRVVGKILEAANLM